MIRKWIKINISFYEILKNSTGTSCLEKRWGSDFWRQNLSTCSLHNEFSSPRALPSVSGGSLSSVIYPFRPHPDGREDGDADDRQHSDPEASAAETPPRTGLFEVKGPCGTAFLIEVLAEDLDEVRALLAELKGELFHFDKKIIEWFTLKCILMGEPGAGAERDRGRLAKIHGIASGSEDVYDGRGKFFFVNSLDGMMRAKRILEKLGYRISGVLYRFQPKGRVSLDERVQKVCDEFLKAVEGLPKVISITHNM